MLKLRVGSLKGLEGGGEAGLHLIDYALVDSDYFLGVPSRKRILWWFKGQGGGFSSHLLLQVCRVVRIPLLVLLVPLLVLLVPLLVLLVALLVRLNLLVRLVPLLVLLVPPLVLLVPPLVLQVPLLVLLVRED